ncbi:MAG: hypothetical protein IPK52_20700 [Chloroflexi bacterium]|nr:hypothetical protein [Chloroflexota bacterium]
MMRAKQGATAYTVRRSRVISSRAFSTLDAVRARDATRESRRLAALKIRPASPPTTMTINPTFCGR